MLICPNKTKYFIIEKLIYRNNLTHSNKLLVKTKLAKDKFMRNAKRVIKNTEGDQITGWLIVILIVVVVGAFFMKNYQDAIVEVWDGVIAKIKSAFGI